VISIDASKTLEQNKALLEAKGFIVTDGTAVVSTVATTHAAQITNSDGAVVTGTRVPIADLTGRNKTTITLHRGDGSVVVPDITNQAAAAACAALVTARLTCSVPGGETRNVASTTPLAGSLVQPNTSVTLNYVP
jgi:hypothetical protein